MTDPSSVVVGLFTNATFGVPLLVLSAVALFWILSKFNHLPPHFRAIGPDRSWMLGPFAKVEQGASADRIAPAVAYASYRVRKVLQLRFRLASVPSSLPWIGRGRYPTEALELIRLTHDLDATYRLAWFAEREERLDVVSHWRRTRWRREARARFASELVRLERVIPPLEAGS